MPPALLITTDEQLATALEMLSGSNFIALDTEFMRERTYYASLCLIQAATPATNKATVARRVMLRRETANRVSRFIQGSLSCRVERAWRP